MIRIFIFLFLPIGILAQDTEPDLEVQSRLETLVEKSDREEVSTDMNIETIPTRLRINDCEWNELATLQLLSPLQLEQFFLYRKRLGVIISMYELQAIPGWDLVLIQKLVPLISLDKKGMINNTLRNRFKSGEQIAFVRTARVIQPSAGFLDSSGFSGGRNSFQFRYSFNHKNLLQWGIAGGNQAGEPISFKRGQLGFDQLSIHAFARQLGKIQLLALGDFRVNFGQGLICWQGMGLSKSAEVIAIKRESPVFQPSATGAASGFFRGAAVSFKFQELDFAVFGALNKKDANIEFDTARSILTSGLRRTANELSDRNNLKVVSIGLRTGMSKRKYSFHLNGLASHWDHQLLKRDLPYNLYAPYGDLFVNASADYAATISNIHLFGEVAVNERSKFAMISGALLSLDKRANISLLYRRISPAFYSWNGNAFTESSYPVNENGFYCGLQLQLSKKIELNVYYDIFSYPWLKFRVGFPSYGNSFLSLFKYSPDKTSEFYIRFKTEMKQENEQGASIILERMDIKQNNFRMNYLAKLNSQINIHIRFEETWNSNNNSGVLLYAEIQKKIPRYGLGIHFRLQYTDTDNYDTRIYAYESDMPYSFSISPQYGQFLKWYVINSINLKKLSKSLPAVSLFVKWSQRFLIDGKSFGSGVNEILGYSQSNISAQLSYLLHN